MKKLIFNIWKTGLYQSKLDLIKYITDRYKAFKKEEVIKNVEDVLTNIDKYEKEFKQTEHEAFFIEFLKLMEKYRVNIGADNFDEKEPKDIRVYFEFGDRTFVQDQPLEMNVYQTNGFITCDDDENSKEIYYEFPCVKDFEDEGLIVKT